MAINSIAFGPAHLKKAWHLTKNPFPPTGIAVLGGEDPRENGTLYNPAVQHEKLVEATHKFVLGPLFSGLRFGYLWSLEAGGDPEARGFGKSSTLQYLTEETNRDFGRRFILEAGLDDEDADANPICAVMASFDMGSTGSLNAVFFQAARYACRTSINGEPTLVQRLRARLAEALGDDDPDALRNACDEIHDGLGGRTLGPPDGEFLDLLCGGDDKKLTRFIDGVNPHKRTRSGANYLATLLLLVRAARVDRVLLACDQLEDLASTITSRQKRMRETERFRDYILELQPMADVLSIVLTMHPRADQAITDMWRLADLPSYDYRLAENDHRVVILRGVEDVAEAEQLLSRYLEKFRTQAPGPDSPMFPFTREAVETMLDRSSTKARDLLVKAHALIERGSAENWDVIDAARAARVLDGFAASREASMPAPLPTAVHQDRADLWAQG